MAKLLSTGAKTRALPKNEGRREYFLNQKIFLAGLGESTQSDNAACECVAFVTWMQVAFCGCCGSSW